MTGTCPAKATRWPNAWLMLGRRRRRRPNINPALGQRLVFSGSLNINLHLFQLQVGANSQDFETRLWTMGCRLQNAYYEFRILCLAQFVLYMHTCLTWQNSYVQSFHFQRNLESCVWSGYISTHVWHGRIATYKLLIFIVILIKIYVCKCKRRAQCHTFHTVNPDELI